MRGVDGSVLVGLLVRDDVGQAVYGMDSDRIATIGAMLLEHDRLVLQDPDVVRAALDDLTPSLHELAPQEARPPRPRISPCYDHFTLRRGG